MDISLAYFKCGSCNYTQHRFYFLKLIANCDMCPICHGRDVFLYSRQVDRDKPVYGSTYTISERLRGIQIVGTKYLLLIELEDNGLDSIQVTADTWIKGSTLVYLDGDPYSGLTVMLSVDGRNPLSVALKSTYEFLSIIIPKNRAMQKELNVSAMTRAFRGIIAGN